ncbi:hypothetical protein G7047_22495 [Diaphorobacter sp. HDW4A]|uniref:hypothetical protein n=1 Tax=Diaphorobacter sp. HDW4A TaxID=2714924 RepID=UPI00140D539B|nr:hypothetical protein [Diaphorobacter sp. HDW4A]QIL82389.1 hypothetical protein G7047_22495 [Diaphorobacter sp. HDW4A]
MHIETVSQPFAAHENRALASLLRAAKKLHRQATSDSLAMSLPVLRRILQSQTLRGVSLPQLHRRRDIVQRKHVLRMLAVEAGHPGWDDYRRAVASMNAEELAQLDVLASRAGYPNHWFSTFEEAERHAKEHGGRAVRVGAQGVVLASSETD